MTELTFTAGARATLDLRDSAGEVVIKDWDGATLKIASAAETPPFVLKDQDTFRIRLDGGGTISLPLGLPAEVVAPAAVQLKVTRAGGETAVRTAPDEAQGPAGRPKDAPVDIAAFADMVSEQGRRIFAEVTRAVRSGGAGVSEEVARRMEEAAERIDEQARRVAERVQREVERTLHAVDHADERARRRAERVEEHARRVAERTAERAHRAAARGRWWFTEKLDEWGAAGQGGARAARPAAATQAERLAVLQMLQEGKITSEQAAKLLDALGA
jgi:hypothetical protein